MSGEREQKLDGIGFDQLATSGPGDKCLTWDEGLDDLRKYRAEHGHCDVPRSQGSLSGWVRSQRALQKNDELSEERIQKLVDLGFFWETKMTWNERLEELAKYKAKHGDCCAKKARIFW